MSPVVVHRNQSGRTESERWADIQGFEGLYQVSDAGRVYSVRAGKMMALRVDKCGYHNVAFKVFGKKSHHLVHRLVAAAFIGNPDGKPNVNHCDFDKQNNHHSNLEWVTHQENMDHFNAAAVGQGRSIDGVTVRTARQSQRLLSQDQARRIRAVYDAGFLTIEELSRAFRIAKSSVYRIVTRETYVL